MANSQSSGAIDDSEYPKVKVSDGVKVTHTGDTDKTVLKTYTVPANAIGANGVLKYHIEGTTDGAGGSKNFEVRLGGELIAGFGNPDSFSEKGYLVEGSVANQGVTNQQQCLRKGLIDGDTNDYSSPTSKALDTTAELELEFNVTLENVGDEANLYYFEVTLLPAD